LRWRSLTGYARSCCYVPASAATRIPSIPNSRRSTKRGDQEGLVSLGLEQWAAAGPDPLITELMRSAQRAWASEEQFEQAGKPVYDRLGELRVPTVLMVGDKDEPGLIASNEAAAARIPGCELIWMPGVDHYPTVRVPGLVIDTILRHCTG
jgi:3-oxoadipate enol-lactonase